MVMSNMFAFKYKGKYVQAIPLVVQHDLPNSDYLHNLPDYVPVWLRDVDVRIFKVVEKKHIIDMDDINDMSDELQKLHGDTLK